MPDDIKWVGQPGFPDRSLEKAVLAGDLNGKGIYYTLVRCFPGSDRAVNPKALKLMCAFQGSF
jgi:hypothetical protein